MKRRGGSPKAGDWFVPQLPEGFRVRLRPGVTTTGDGRLLVGGSPRTLVELGRPAVDGLEEVLTVGDAASAAVAARLLADNLADPVLDPAKGPTEADLTVVVPAYNSAQSLDRALTALAGGSEVIVVDDASSDGGATVAVAERHGVRLIRREMNGGPGAARNTGLRAVRTPLVAFVDADIRVTPTALRGLLAHFADPGLALVAPRVVGVVNSPHPRWFERFDSVHSSLDRGTEPAQVADASAVNWLPGACLIGRVAALGDGFDESLRVGEDLDFVWRLIDSGARIRYDPTVCAAHDTRTTIGHWLARKTAYGASLGPLSRIHPHRIAAAEFSGPRIPLAAAVALPGWWSVPIIASVMAHTTVTAARRLPEATDLACAWGIATQQFEHTAGRTTDLWLRHWWPVLLVGLPFSACLRRAGAVALIADVVRIGRYHQRGVDATTYLAGARCDDLAFGLGLWIGAFRGRTLRPLLPRLR